MKLEKLDLTDEVREKLSGNILALTKGKTYYEIIEEDSVKDLQIEKKKWIVLVHGFSTPMFVWDNLIETLKANGYSIVRFDLYGRGYSDRPKITYTIELFTTQLQELITHIGLDKIKFHLVGLSMGGNIVTVFTANNPEQIKSLTLVDPAGLPSDIDKPPTWIFKIPGVSKLINTILLKNWVKNFHRPENFPKYKDKFMEQMKYRGFSQAIKSSLINIPLDDAQKEYKKIGQSNIPTLLFWGEEDQTIPYLTHKKVQKYIPNINFISVPDCGHMPQYEKPEIFNKEILKFLNENS